MTPDGAKGAGRIGALLPLIGLSREPADHSVVVASMAALVCPEPTAILRGWACSLTGSVIVSTPRSYEAWSLEVSRLLPRSSRRVKVPWGRSAAKTSSSSLRSH